MAMMMVQFADDDGCGEYCHLYHIYLFQIRDKIQRTANRLYSSHSTDGMSLLLVSLMLILNPCNHYIFMMDWRIYAYIHVCTSEEYPTMYACICYHGNWSMLSWVWRIYALNHRQWTSLHDRWGQYPLWHKMGEAR